MNRWYLVALAILALFGLALYLTRPAPRPAAPVNPSGSLQAAGLATMGLEQPTGAPQTVSPTSDGGGAPPTAMTVAPAMARNPHLTPPPDGIGGEATWWDSFGSGLYAAIRPDLGRRGELAVVCGPVLPPNVIDRDHPWHCLSLPVTTTCACLGPGSGRLIDLSLDAFASFAPPSRGVVRITLQVVLP